MKRISKNSTVFILLTPLSYLNASELKHHLGLSREESIICFLTEHSESFNHLDSIIDPSKWGDIHYLYGRKGRSMRGSKLNEYFHTFFNFIRILRFSGRIKKADRIVVGNILNPWMRYLISRSPCDEVYVLDDGTATIPILTQNKDIRDHFRTPDMIRGRKNLLLRYMQKSPVQNERLYFFTLFDRWNKDQTLRIIPNHLALFRKSVPSVSKSTEVMFIGSPLVEFNLIPKMLFLRIMDHIRTAVKDRPIRYIQHRTERISDELGMDQVLPDKPLEYFFLEMESMPAVILSFFSTAGMNLRHIYGDLLTIINLKIDESSLENTRYAEALNLMSEYYKKIEDEHFQIFTLDPDQNPAILRSFIELH